MHESMDKAQLVAAAKANLAYWQRALAKSEAAFAPRWKADEPHIIAYLRHEHKEVAAAKRWLAHVENLKDWRGNP